MQAVYIHIPFCTHICSYCDFPKLLYHPKYIKKYLNSLKQETESRYQNELVSTIYIGGGTPTSLSDEELEQLLKIVTIFNTTTDCEYTIESNIESLTPSKIKLLTKYHVNRVSLGVESFNQDNLRYLNRNHTKDQVTEVIHNLKKHQITNINIDLIYAINDNIDIVKEDINNFLKLDIPHISCYSLIIEEHTKLNNINTKYIDEETDYQMYKYIRKTLTKHNYYQYEISNYAKEGYESKHNLTYWQNKEYYGFGLGAVSYQNRTRRTNTKNLTKYLHQDYLDNETYEDEQTTIENDIILNLRTTKGLNLEKFQQKHHQKLTDIYDITNLLKNKQLIINDNYLSISKYYLYLSNEILIQFLK